MSIKINRTLFSFSTVTSPWHKYMPNTQSYFAFLKLEFQWGSDCRFGVTVTSFHYKPVRHAFSEIRPHFLVRLSCSWFLRAIKHGHNQITSSDVATVNYRHKNWQLIVLGHWECTIKTVRFARPQKFIHLGASVHKKIIKLILRIHDWTIKRDRPFFVTKACFSWQPIDFMFGAESTSLAVVELINNSPLMLAFDNGLNFAHIFVLLNKCLKCRLTRRRRLFHLVSVFHHLKLFWGHIARRLGPADKCRVWLCQLLFILFNQSMRVILRFLVLQCFPVVGIEKLALANFMFAFGVEIERAVALVTVDPVLIRSFWWFLVQTVLLALLFCAH